MQEIVIFIDNIIFIVNPNMEYEGDINNPIEYAYFLAIKNMHEQMAIEFQDPINLDEFKVLLLANPNTAFELYNQSKGRNMP